MAVAKQCHGTSAEIGEQIGRDYPQICEFECGQLALPTRPTPGSEGPPGGGRDSRHFQPPDPGALTKSHPSQGPIPTVALQKQDTLYMQMFVRMNDVTIGVWAGGIFRKLTGAFALTKTSSS